MEKSKIKIGESNFYLEYIEGQSLEVSYAGKGQSYISDEIVENIAEFKQELEKVVKHSITEDPRHYSKLKIKFADDRTSYTIYELQALAMLNNNTRFQLDNTKHDKYLYIALLKMAYYEKKSIELDPTCELYKQREKKSNVEDNPKKTPKKNNIPGYIFMALLAISAVSMLAILAPILAILILLITAVAVIIYLKTSNIQNGLISSPDRLAMPSKIAANASIKSEATLTNDKNKAKDNSTVQEEDTKSHRL